MLKILSILTLLFCVCTSHAQAIRIACVGDSITYGAYIKNREKDSYPAQLGKILGEKFDVKNFGFNGATTLFKGNFPYVKTKRYANALKFNPNIVIIKLGTNDSKAINIKYADTDFEKDLSSIIESFKALPTNPKIYLCIPVPAFMNGKNIDADRVKNIIIPKVKNVAKKYGLKTINLYDVFDGKGKLFPDKIHPNEEGAKIIATEISKHIIEK